MNTKNVHMMIDIDRMPKGIKGFAIYKAMLKIREDEERGNKNIYSKEELLDMFETKTTATLKKRMKMVEEDCNFIIVKEIYLSKKKHYKIKSTAILQDIIINAGGVQ